MEHEGYLSGEPLNCESMCMCLTLSEYPDLHVLVF